MGKSVAAMKNHVKVSVAAIVKPLSRQGFITEQKLLST